MDIPSHPERVYKDEWNGWPDFLGTDYLYKYDKNNHLPFEELKDIVRSNHITSIKEYREWRKRTKIKGIPLCPNKAYEDEWVSWVIF